MDILAVRQLLAVKATEEGWAHRVQERIEAGTNFFLIFPGQSDDIQRFCHMFGLASDCSPKTSTPAEFMLMAPYIDPATFDEALRAWEKKCEVAFVEQLDFPVNRPPRVKNYLVYSSVWGIISQHDDARTAAQSLARYREETPGHSPTPDADIYLWDGKKWRMK